VPAVDRRLVERAPESVDALLRLLADGLHWPIPADMEPDEPFVDWEPEELRLDPKAVARLTSIRQMRPLETGQPFGVFFLTFEDGRLPVGAVRRLVDRLVRKKRPSGPGTHPVWGLDDLLFVVQSSGGARTVHFVAFKESAGLRSLKVLSWSTESTDMRVELLAERLGDLAWPTSGVWDDEWRDRWRGVFSVGHREGIRSSATLAARMADVAKEVRGEVLALHEVETDDGPIRGLLRDTREHLLHDLSVEHFADMYAQTMVYGLLTARITHPEAFAAEGTTAILRFENPFLDAIYARFREQTGEAFDVDELGLRDLADELGRTNVDELLADFGAADRRDDPVVHFYETFLAQYDPAQRIELGAFYTPTPVVRFMVRAVDEVLKRDFCLTLGIADATSWSELAKRVPSVEVPPDVDPDSPFVSMIDPATGTGTYVVEWIKHAQSNVVSAARAEGCTEAQAQERWMFWLRDVVVPQLNAFEISLASYAVAHLKVSLMLPAQLRSEIRLPIYLTDTLAPPLNEGRFELLADPLSLEGAAAEKVKFERHATVVLGNPPYKDRADGLGGWIEDGMPGFPAPMEAFYSPAMGRYKYLLANLYVYFWRWATLKVFGRGARGTPGVIAFITTAGYTTGPGFAAMREYLRRRTDRGWVVDLSAEGHRPDVPTRVFPSVQQPLSIAIFASSGSASKDKVSDIRFRSLSGTREQKFTQLDNLELSSEAWEEVANAPLGAPLLPTSDASWLQAPLLGDVMPWATLGVKTNRNWVSAPTAELLRSRWLSLQGASEDVKPRLMKETADRDLSSRLSLPLFPQPQVGIRDDSGAPPNPIKYAMRSFDVQWLIPDGRLIDRPRPGLWFTRSARQLYLATQFDRPVTSGPAVVAACHVPDTHIYAGRSGRVYPLYRDLSGDKPNLAPGLISVIEEKYGFLPSPEDVFAYLAGVAAHRGFTDYFREQLRTPGVRVPLTAGPALFSRAVALGVEVLECHTLGERRPTTPWSEGQTPPVSPGCAVTVRAPGGRGRGNVRLSGDPWACRRS
jgi:hypothetical protein